MVNEIAVSGGNSIIATSSAPRAAAPRQTSSKGASAPIQEAGSTAEAAVQVGQHLQQARPELRLQVDGGSGRTVFQVVQQGTGQVLMQVPSEEVLGMSRRLREAEGLPGTPGTLVDKQG